MAINYLRSQQYPGKFEKQGSISSTLKNDEKITLKDLNSLIISLSPQNLIITFGVLSNNTTY